MISVPLGNRTKKRNSKLQISLMVNTEGRAARKPETGNYSTRAGSKLLEMGLDSTLCIPPLKPRSKRDLFPDWGICKENPKDFSLLG